ncbi:Telomeric repeat-binding factor 2-interacting protein 1 [Mactra antiquata]
MRLRNFVKMAADAVTSKKLFTKENGDGMVFFMRPCNERQLLRPVIENGGGSITSKLVPDSIKLAEIGSRVSSDDFISAKFITDCVDQNKLLDTVPYKVRPGTRVREDSASADDSVDIGFDSDDSMSPAPNIIHISREIRGRSQYSRDDDLSILYYLLDERRYNEATGMRVYKDMEIMKVTHHSAQSMNTRYRKHILPNIEKYRNDIGSSGVSKFTGYVSKQPKDATYSVDALFPFDDKKQPSKRFQPLTFSPNTSPEKKQKQNKESNIENKQTDSTLSKNDNKHLNASDMSLSKDQHKMTSASDLSPTKQNRQKNSSDLSPTKVHNKEKNASNLSPTKEQRQICVRDFNPSKEHVQKSVTDMSPSKYHNKQKSDLSSSEDNGKHSKVIQSNNKDKNESNHVDKQTVNGNDIEDNSDGEVYVDCQENSQDSFKTAEEPRCSPRPHDKVHNSNITTRRANRYDKIKRVEQNENTVETHCSQRLRNKKDTSEDANENADNDNNIQSSKVGNKISKSSKKGRLDTETERVVDGDHTYCVCVDESLLNALKLSKKNRNVTNEEKDIDSQATDMEMEETGNSDVSNKDERDSDKDKTIGSTASEDDIDISLDSLDKKLLETAHKVNGIRAVVPSEIDTLTNGSGELRTESDDESVVMEVLSYEQTVYKKWDEICHEICEHFGLSYQFVADLFFNCNADKKRTVAYINLGPYSSLRPPWTMKHDAVCVRNPSHLGLISKYGPEDVQYRYRLLTEDDLFQRRCLDKKVHSSC